jgi:hypothetical protein
MTKPRLLSVARARAEISAGVPGRCAISVRVLDDVTLRIHAGELLLVRAPEALAQSMLLAALAGREHSPRHRYVRSTRDAAPGLRIRRAALHVDAVQEIMRGWQDAHVPATAPASRTLYLLRASRAGSVTRREAAEWRQWGRQAHERRDGIVIACSPASLHTGHELRQRPVRAAHEPRAAYALDTPAASSRTIRLLELRAGRLHRVRTPRRYRSNPERLTADPVRHPWSAGGSSDAHAPTASRPSPRASPES